MKRNPNTLPRFIKKFICKSLAFLIIPSLVLPLAAQSYGIIGSVLTTDIKAYINGYEIPAYNVDGNMVIVGSDLRNYGFYVVYDNNARTSSVSLNPYGAWSPLDTSSYSHGSIGTKVMDVYDTDISVLLNGVPVTSYNVNGNMAFKFSELKMFGSYYYDNASRTTNLWLEGNSYSQPSEDYSYYYNDTPADNPDMYSSSGSDDGFYSLGETWIVDGQWELTINSVEEHRLCDDYWNKNYGYSNEQVVIINYSYKNLGYQGSIMDLYINDFNVYDCEGEAADEYVGCDHQGGQKECIIGTKCSNAKTAFALVNPSSEIIVSFEKYASDGTGTHKVVYRIPVGNHQLTHTPQKNSTSDDSASTYDEQMVFLGLVKNGIECYSGAFQNLTYYIRSQDKSFVTLFYQYLQASYDSFSSAYEMSTTYLDMATMTSDIEEITDAIEDVLNETYSLIEIRDILEPPAENFQIILNEFERLFS